VTHIDVRSALESALHTQNSDLVTRPTGAAVRTIIERRIAGLADGTVVYLDFTHIRILDRSCADEFVAKLVGPMAASQSQHEGYVVLNGLTEDHLDAIEGVLEAHGLALVVQFEDGVSRLVGQVSSMERRCWEIVTRSGTAAIDLIAETLELPVEDCHELLNSLAQRRLLRRDDDRYVALGTAA
jgi:hypothetical protein